MRLLFDATVLQQPATGIAKATVLLYRECLNLMPSMQVIAAHRKPLMTLLPPGMDSLRSGAYIPSRLWRSIMLPLMMSLTRPSAVHFPWNGRVPRLCSGAVVVTTLHDVLPLVIPGHFDSDSAERAYRIKTQSDIDRSDILITVSRYSRNEIVRNFRTKKEPLVLYLGPTLGISDEADYQPSEEGVGYFLYVGGYDRRKGLLPLLRVMLALHRSKKISSRLILTGSPVYFSSELRSLIAEGKALGIIEEKGYVPDSLLYRLYRNANALVYPSKFEGFGLPPLEAMHSGCPVITTKHTSLPEVCGEAALYVEPEDESNFAAALIALERDRRLREELREKGARQASGFSWKKSAEIFLRELDTILRARRL